MKAPENPDSESDRLSELKSLCILDTSPELFYDSITELAAQICKVPIALVSFVDERRQWIKASVGWHPQLISLKDSFCAHTILQKDPLIVPDAREDERFNSNSLVTGEPYLRFYAGVPLVTAPGHALGALCVIDKSMRSLDHFQLQSLQKLAAMTLAHLEQRRKNAELKEKVIESCKMADLLTRSEYLEMRHRKDFEEIDRHQKTMLYSSKMAALGEMAGGIAHEINNPLAMISGRSQLLRMMVDKKTASESNILMNLDKIDQTVTRILKMVNGLRDFSRNAEGEAFENCHVKKIVDDTLELCVARFRNDGIVVRRDEIADELQIQCRGVQISQILLNLLNNAADAIGKLDQRWIEIRCYDFGEEIELRVRDSGSGIPAAIQQKIMQPFFTTKEIGKGTGLGLSVSMGLAVGHQGKLFLDNADSNTCFVVRLPKLQQKLEKAS